MAKYCLERLNTRQALHSRDSHFRQFTFSCFWGRCCELSLSSAQKKRSSEMLSLWGTFPQPRVSIATAEHPLHPSAETHPRGSSRRSGRWPSVPHTGSPPGSGPQCCSWSGGCLLWRFPQPGRVSLPSRGRSLPPGNAGRGFQHALTLWHPGRAAGLLAPRCPAEPCPTSRTPHRVSCNRPACNPPQPSQENSLRNLNCKWLSKHHLHCPCWCQTHSPSHRSTQTQPNWVP